MSDPWLVTRVFPAAAGAGVISARAEIPGGGPGTLALVEISDAWKEGYKTLAQVSGKRGDELVASVSLEVLQGASKSAPIVLGKGRRARGLYLLAAAGDLASDLVAAVDARIDLPGAGDDTPLGMAIEVTGGGTLWVQGGGFPGTSLMVEAAVGPTMELDCLDSASGLYSRTGPPPADVDEMRQLLLTFMADREDLPTANESGPLLALRGGRGIVAMPRWRTLDGACLGIMNVAALLKAEGDLLGVWYKVKGAAQYGESPIQRPAVAKIEYLDFRFGDRFSASLPYGVPRISLGDFSLRRG